MFLDAEGAFLLTRRLCQGDVSLDTPRVGGTFPSTHDVKPPRAPGRAERKHLEQMANCVEGNAPPDTNGELCQEKRPPDTCNLR